MDTKENNRMHLTGRRPRRKAESSRPVKEENQIRYTPAKPFNRNRFLLHLATVVAVLFAVMSIFFKVDENKILISGAEKYTLWQIKEAAGIQDGDHFIHSLGALAAKGRHHHRAATQTKFFPGIGFLGEDELPTDRHTNHFHLLLIPVILRAFREADHYPIRPFGDQPGSQARHCVRLVNTGGDLQLTGCKQCRETGVATGTYHHIRLKLPE